MKAKFFNFLITISVPFYEKVFKEKLIISNLLSTKLISNVKYKTYAYILYISQRWTTLHCSLIIFDSSTSSKHMIRRGFAHLKCEEVAFWTACPPVLWLVGGHFRRGNMGTSGSQCALANFMVVGPQLVWPGDDARHSQSSVVGLM